MVHPTYRIRAWADNSWIRGVRISIMRRLEPETDIPPPKELLRWNDTGAEFVPFDPVSLGDPADVLTLTEESAQELADSLWEAGVRPRGAAGSIGAMAAAQQHINDLREVAFKTLGIDTLGRQ